MDNFRIETDADGIALVLFEAPGKTLNVLSAQALAEFGEVVERLKTDAAIKGAVIASGKASGFCAGVDLNEMVGGAFDGDDDASAFEHAFILNKVYRALETCGKPVAIALEGLTLGGGYEMALACHYRVAGEGSYQIGLPEAKIGIFPGGGGSQRLPRLIGVQAAAPFLSEGKTVTPKEALAAGMIHAVVPAGGAVEAAKAWIKTSGDPKQPWDKPGFKIPGGGPYTPSGFQVFVMGSALLRKQTYGNYPGQLNLLKAVYEGLQLGIDQAVKVESRYFVATLRTWQAKAMIRSLFVSMQALGKGSARPVDAPRTPIRKAGVLGAGMMGAGIAYVQAYAGIDTVLIDMTQEAADKGKAHAADLVGKQVSRGKLTPEKAAEILARIHPTPDYGALAGCDIVIEAVFENREVKAEATRKAEAALGPDAVFGSNTSTLPITGLATASVRPESFIGVHFFSPVEKMGLVEIILGEKTAPATLAKAIDYVLKIKKTPIVVHDARGFYTSRCFSTFLEEGIEMLAEGIAPAIIDNVGRATGMPRGPLEMADDVALDLIHKIADQTRKDLGEAYRPRASDGVIEALVGQGRLGRKNGKGFYDYPEGAPKTLWPGLAEVAPVKTPEADLALIDELRMRLLYRQAVEAARCFEEGVVRDPRDADVGAILGWGFAPWTGGPLGLIDGTGLAAFVAACDRLAERHGPRFAPPKLLRDMAAEGRTLYAAGLVQAA